MINIASFIEYITLDTQIRQNHCMIYHGVYELLRHAKNIRKINIHLGYFITSISPLPPVEIHPRDANLQYYVKQCIYTVIYVYILNRCISSIIMKVLRKNK